MASKKEQTIKLQKELSQNIEAMRKDFQQIVEKYRINVEAELVNCLDLLSSKEEDDFPAAANDPKQLEFMIQAMQSMKYKTEKGRMKDLSKIHYLVKMLVARFSE